MNHYLEAKEEGITTKKNEKPFVNLEFIIDLNKNVQ
jgi:hypothetical protein